MQRCRFLGSTSARTRRKTNELSRAPKPPCLVTPEPPLSSQRLDEAVERVVTRTPVHDIHTHLYAPAFGDLLLWGIDDLLVYHSLVAEGFRHWELSYEKFWTLDKTTQAELIWTSLFVQSSPISEACRGVLTTLNALGLDVRQRDLHALRQWFAGHKVEGHLLRVMDLAGVRTICMTNSPFDDQERAVWQSGWTRDARFTSALRVDPLLLDWPQAQRHLVATGYAVDDTLNARTLAEVRRFLADWSHQIHAQYLIASLPPDLVYPANTVPARLIEEAILPHCEAHNLPFALMLGVKRAVNPALRLAGDGVGRADLAAYERLFAPAPSNKFLITPPARENQHDLCVIARKFRNVHLFGCWWFTNVPSLIDETTRMRLELLGLSMTPQHSDARVLDQLIYKWKHSRRVIADVLKDKYRDLAATGWHVTEAEISRDVQALFGGAFEAFLQRRF